MVNQVEAVDGKFFATFYFTVSQGEYDLKNTVYVTHKHVA